MYELGIITQFRDEAPYLDEWIEYHRLAGADHFWIRDDGSTDDWRAVLAPHVVSGLVEVLPAGGVPLAALASDRQLETIRDGLRLASGRARWVALIDVDEFLLPMVEGTVPACLGRCFAEASAVYVNWRMFGTSGVIVPPGRPLLPSLTACSLPSHPENGIGKSLVRPDRVVVDDVWYAHHVPLEIGSAYFDGGGNRLCFGMRSGRSDLLTAGAHFDDRIRINHYNLRDERFYATNRVRRAREGRLPGKSLDRLLEHHASFGKTQDRKILDFLERHHRVDYDRIWPDRRRGCVYASAAMRR